MDTISCDKCGGAVSTDEIYIGVGDTTICEQCWSVEQEDITICEQCWSVEQEDGE